MPYLIYLHGFNSSENAYKAQLLKQYCAQKGVQDSLLVPRLDWQPQKAIEQIEDLIRPRLQQGVCLLGSSLGGFYGNYLAHKYDVKTVAFNPAVQAPVLIEAYLGEQINTNTGEKYCLTQTHIEQLKALAVPMTKPELFWLLLQKGDETLNYKDALTYYQGVDTVLEDGGSHTFEGFERYLQAVLAFANIRTV